MKETLESARNTHNIIIVSCLIIIVFAISIIPQENPYRLALTDITQTEDTLIKLIKANKIRLGYDSSFTIYPESYIMTSMREDSLLEMIDEVNAQVKHSNSLNQTILKNNARNRELSLEALEKLNILRDSAIKHGVRWEVELYDSLLKETRDAYLTGLEAFSEADLSTGKKHTYKRLTNLPPPNDYDPDKITLANLNSFSEAFADSALFKTLLAEHHSFVYFYNSNDEKSVSEVRKILDEEANKFDSKPTDDVDISGIKVAARNMYRIGPFIVLGLLIYLTTLVIHAESTLNWREHLGVAEEFPWVALFKSTFSEGVSFASMILLPMLMTTVIVHASDLDLGTKRIWLGTYFALFSPTLWFLGTQIDKLRKRINDRPFIPRIENSDGTSE